MTAILAGAAVRAAAAALDMVVAGAFEALLDVLVERLGAVAGALDDEIGTMRAFHAGLRRKLDTIDGRLAAIDAHLHEATPRQ